MKRVALFVFAALSLAIAGYAASAEDRAIEGGSVDEDTACTKGCFKNVNDRTIDANPDKVLQDYNLLMKTREGVPELSDSKAHHDI